MTPIPTLEQELAFIGGRFTKEEVPKDQQYLFKYFDTEVQQVFVGYYLVFRSVGKFVDHTGHHSSRRWLDILALRLRTVETALDRAKKAGDTKTVELIRSGKYAVKG